MGWIMTAGITFGSMEGRLHIIEYLIDQKLKPKDHWENTHLMMQASWK